ncbi:MAG: amidohydrolase family protein [Actinobacteria bacterium]|nr:amidohydrolase family protein [Actinomycetota bacterium]
MTSRLLLRGGLVADGIGTTVQRADVLIEGPVIAAVGSIGVSPGESAVIDLAPGSVVCPGFIDAHVHAEGPLLADGRVAGALAQGVTTLVVGQDGESWIGASAPTVRYLNRYFAPVNGALEPARDFRVASFREAAAGRLAQNVAVLASQGTIRHNVAGMASGPLGDAERAAARRQVEDALAEGAVGLSSGLDYLPSRFGGMVETAEIARPLADADRPYVSHLRGYGRDVRAGLDELVAVGAGAGTRVHASHLWGEPATIETALIAADTAGVGLTYDMYFYRKSSTILAQLLLPPEVQADGPDRTLAALTDPGQRAVLLDGEKLTGTYLRNVYLGTVPGDRAGDAGLSVAEAAARDGRPPGEWVLDLLVAADLNVGGHLDRLGLTDAHLAWISSCDRHCAGSDGIYQGQHPHPRGYGAFARLAEHYLAAGPEAGYQRLARHLAANAADAYGLRSRGRVAAGMAADLCVIGAAGLTAHATYDRPRELATGVDHVFVNGALVWPDSRTTAGQLPGQLVS